MPKEFSISAQLPEERPKPEAVNFFTVSRMGHDVQLLAGFIDLKTAVDAAQQAESHVSSNADETEIAIPVDVTHRLVMGPNAFLNLKQKVDEIYEAMQESGHLPEHPTPAEGEA